MPLPAWAKVFGGLLSWSAVAFAGGEGSTLIPEPGRAVWHLLTDGQARPTLPRSSRIERLAGSARFAFSLEVNDGDSLGKVGFVRAETPVSVALNADDLLCLNLLRSDPQVRVTIYLRSAESDLDLQFVATDEKEVPLSSFQFVKWGRPIPVSAQERFQFLGSITTFGLQVARSRQNDELRSRAFSGEFGLSGPVSLKKGPTPLGEPKRL